MIGKTALGIPLDVARTFEPRLRELCGFGVYSGLIGHIERRSPADVVLDGTAGRATVTLARADLARYAPLAGPVLRASVEQGRLDARAVVGWSDGGAAWTVSDGGLAVTGLRVTGTDDGAVEDIPTSLLLRSIGYRGAPLGDLEFDQAAGIVPNTDGRVLDAADRPVPGVYVTGWIKRGPRGVIGTNRTCAEETVDHLFEDFDAGVLGSGTDTGDRDQLRALLADRGLAPVDWAGWRGIDAAERDRGAGTARPRVKFVAIDEMLSAARK